MESPAMLAPTLHVARPSPSLPFVHRYYILLKIHYFLFFSAFGMLYPIINITLRGRGLSNIELSYINIIIPFLIFFTNPLLGYIADRSRRYLSTFNVVLIISTILYIALFLLPIIKTYNIEANLTVYDKNIGHVLNFCASDEVKTKCASRSECGCSFNATCTPTMASNEKKPFSFVFSMNSIKNYNEIQGTTSMSKSATCGIQYRVPVEEAIKKTAQNSNSFQTASCEITCSIPHYCQGQRHDNPIRSVLIYSIVFILANNLLSNAIPLGASIGFASLTSSKIFGEQRVFGTIGFGISAFVASRIYAIFKTEHVYIIMFCITAVICMIVTSFIRLQPSKQTPTVTNDKTIVEENEIDDISVEKKKKKSQRQSSVLLRLLKNIDVLIFLSLTFIWGMSYAGLDPYLYLYVDEISPCQSHLIVGWMSLTSSIAEIIGFFLASRLIKKLGTNLASVIILLAFSIRFAGYYYISIPYLLILMETMHFFNFGILYVLISQKADSIAPPGLSGTLQGVALGVSFGLGRGVGLLIASLIYTLIEQRVLFLIIAIFNLIAAIIFSLYFILNRQYSKKSIKNNDNIAIEENDVKSKEEPLLVESINNEINDK